MSIPETMTESGMAQQMPGRLLREMREKQGLTVSEVAGVIKFSPRQIEALESDDFDLLQGKTFLRGFVRAYARMLKLTPEPLLEMLEAENLPVQDLVVPPENMGETDPKPFYRKHVKKLLMLIGVVTAALTAIWFRLDIDRFQVSKDTEAADVASAQPPVTIEPVPVLVEPVVDSISGTAAVPAEKIDPVAAPPSLTLVFEFSDLSWLEVKDGSGQVLLTGEFPGGQVQTVTGKPPYQVWIGKSSAVKVTYQGQPVDTQPFTREDVARLTLGL